MALLKDVNLRDTRTNQPAAGAGNNGFLYCVTDEGNIIERSNASAWQAFSPGVSAGGGLSLVENKIITSAVTSVTFSGLNGNTDGVYKLLAQIKNGANALTFYTVRPNGQTTNLSTIYHTDNGGGSSNNTDTVWYLCGADALSWGEGEALLHAIQSSHSVSQNRTFQSMSGYSNGGNLQILRTVGLWNESSTNITTIDVVATQTNGIGDGSVIGLYKFAQS